VKTIGAPDSLDTVSSRNRRADLGLEGVSGVGRIGLVLMH